MDHASFGSSLASHSQVADTGNHCPQGCVHVTHRAVARRGMFIVDRAILRLLTQASLLGGPLVDHCVVWCALLTQRTCARVCWHIVFFTLSIFSEFLFFFTFYTLSRSYWFHGCTPRSLLHSTTRWCTKENLSRNKSGSLFTDFDLYGKSPEPCFFDFEPVRKCPEPCLWILTGTECPEPCLWILTGTDKVNAPGMEVPNDAHRRKRFGAQIAEQALR